MVAMGSEVAAKIGPGEKEKRGALYYLLMPVARTGAQIDALNLKILKTPLAGIDQLLQEAVRRHLLNDLLDPLQQFSPLEPKDDLTSQIVAIGPDGNFAVPREKLDEFSRVTRAVVHACQENVLKSKLPARLLEIIVGLREHIGQVNLLTDGHDFLAQLIVRGMERHGQPVTRRRFRQPANGFWKSDRGDCNPSRADAEAIVAAGLL